MSYLHLILGVLLYVGTLADLIKTTFSATGGGKLTNIISRGIWHVFFALSGRRGRSRLLPYAGPTILIAILSAWILGLWLGFFFVLLSDPLSVKNATTSAPADSLEKLYYAAFTLSTLGTGDFVATTNSWRITTGLAAFSGLAFITASITYFGPVLSAIGYQSRLALSIHSMGATPQQILIHSWNGRDFSGFSDRIPDICQMLFQHTLNHHAYPVVHYFHSSKPAFAVAPSVAILHEVLWLLETSIADEVGPDALRRSMLETALSQFLMTLKGNFIDFDSVKDPVPVPDIAFLKQQGIPLRNVPGNESDSPNPISDQRNLVSGLLGSDGWAWSDVYEQDSI